MTAEKAPRGAGSAAARIGVSRGSVGEVGDDRLYRLDDPLGPPSQSARSRQLKTKNQVSHREAAWKVRQPGQDLLKSRVKSRRHPSPAMAGRGIGAVMGHLFRRCLKMKATNAPTPSRTKLEGSGTDCRVTPTVKKSMA
jgi:hypothetical protein